MFNFLKGTSRKRNTPIEMEKVPTLLHFCFCNARDLFEEAELLRKNKRYARAFYLCIAALEELAKIPIGLNAIILPNDDKRAWKGFWKNFNSHELKQNAMKQYGQTILKAGDKKRWKKFYNKEFPAALPLNEMKWASLYVDCYEGIPLRPNELFKLEGSIESIFDILRGRISGFSELHSTIDKSIQFVRTARENSIDSEITKKIINYYRNLA